MTCAALLCLAQIEDVLGKKQDDVAVAMNKGSAWLGDNFTLIRASQPYYYLDVLSRMGTTARRNKFGDKDKAHDWRREGSAWLVEHQHKDGRFQGDNAINGPVIGTAFALRFLHASEKSAND